MFGWVKQTDLSVRLITIRQLIRLSGTNPPQKIGNDPFSTSDLVLFIFINLTNPF